MGEETKIEWTHHTFNPWRGCTKVSPGCDHCYADAMSGRNPSVLGKWGPNGVRALAAESYWKLPLQWDAKAADLGERHRVFCASLADVFEGNDTMPVAAHHLVRAARIRLFQLIDATPNLDWLLLTKRPENIRPILHDISNGNSGAWNLFEHMPNVWLGTSVENQDQAEKRIPELLSIPATIHFLSCEPLLGPLNLGRRQAGSGWDEWLTGRMHRGPAVWAGEPKIDWIIAGGESGKAARPMHPAWVQALRDQCVEAGVPFFFKQWGEWAAFHQSGLESSVSIEHLRGPDVEHSNDPCPMYRLGKHNAGRLLDGRAWSEIPGEISL